MAITLSPGPVACNPQVMTATLSIQTAVASRATGPITVATILDNLFRQVGLTADQYDVTAATDVVDGFTINNRASVKDIIDVLLRVYQVDLVEIDGQLVAVKRGSVAVATLTADDIGAYVWSGGTQADPKVRARRVQPLELPSEGDITYLSYAKDFEQSSQRAVRSVISYVDDKLTINTPLLLTDDFARQTIERLLYELWVHRDSFALVLTPKWMYLSPGDCINIPHAGQTRRVRIIGMDTALFGPIPVECVLDEIGVLTQTIGGGVTPPATTFPGVVADTTLFAFSTNALRDADAASVGFYTAVNGATEGDWPGCILYMSRDGGLTYEPVGDSGDGSSYGVTTSTLAAPSPEQTAHWDTVSTVDFTLTAGTAPVTVSEAEVLNGENTVRIAEEVLQFRTVTSLGGDSYRLSNLLRGKRGTDPFWGSHTSSDDVVFLENGGATVRVVLDETLVNKTVKLKAVTIGQTLVDATSQDLTVTGDEWKCYSGCLLTGARDGGNNLTIDWERRTRSGGGWADFIDADQPEAVEAYEVDILVAAVVVRTISVSTSTATYSAANQTSDGITPGDPVTVSIYQIGRYGRGYPLEGVI